MRILVSIILSLPLVGAYAIFGIGIVLIYRASQVLNLAHGAMAMVPAYLLYSLVEAGIPTPIGFLIALAAGAGLGLAVERVFVRRLRSQSATAQTVGTVAALGIMVALAAKIWGTTPREAVRIFPKGYVSIGSSGIQVGEIGLFLVMAVVAAGLYALLQRTDLGLMMRGTAESRLAAALHGVNPDRITEVTWALGGGLAALAGILLAAVTNLNPYVLTLQALPGFIAALLGGLGSLPGAVVGAAAVGVTQGFVPVIGFLSRTEGAPQLFLAVLALVVMSARGKTIVAASDVREGPGAGLTGRRARPRTWIVAGVVALVFPWVVNQSLVGAANLAAAYALVAISVVILTGWVGQISLGHAALVGIGAYVTGWAAGGMGIPFPLSILLAIAAAALAAAGLGMVALRVRGLYLAVATLVFSWMASEFLFRQDWFTKHDQIPARAIGGVGSFPAFDFTDRRLFFLAAWALVAAAAYSAVNLRDFKFGRAFFAVRGSEMAAASLGIDVMRTKLVAFAVSGGLAGAAGNLLMSDARVVSPDQFTFNISLFYLAVAVVGGLVSVGGAIASGLVFAGLTELFFRVPALGGLLEIVSALLLAIVLLVYSGGLASIPVGIRRALTVIRGRREGTRSERPRPEPAALKEVNRVLASAEARLRAGIRRVRPTRPPKVGRKPGVRIDPDMGPIDFRATLATEPHANGHAASSEIDKALPPTIGSVTAARPSSEHALGPREARAPMVEADSITVQFGGLTAVSNASLVVRRGEIVGLIGPNGAGKTTLFNAIAGFNSPAAGRIRLYEQDVTAYPIHRRAAVGVARTFQAIQLFGSLSVFENLLVATHVHNPTGLVSNVWATEKALHEEAVARHRVRDVLGLLELSHIADRRVGDLPFGVLRMVEVARALVTGFRVMMLDEPASGLDNRETDRLMDVLRYVRQLGVTQLLIEHDVRMVTAVTDYMYVLDQGKIIAEGVPDDVQRNPSVIAAYLGEPAGHAEVTA